MIVVFLNCRGIAHSGQSLEFSVFIPDSMGRASCSSFSWPEEQIFGTNHIIVPNNGGSQERWNLPHLICGEGGEHVDCDFP